VLPIETRVVTVSATAAPISPGDNARRSSGASVSGILSPPQQASSRP